MITSAGALALWIGMPSVDLGTALSDPTSWQHQALVKLQLPRIAQGLAVGAVLGVAHGTDAAAKVLKPVQSGIVRTYAAGVAIGTVALAVFVIMRMGF